MLTKEEINILEEVWRIFGQWSAKQLEFFTHQHNAWIESYGERHIGSRCEEVMTISAIKQDFKALLKAKNNDSITQFSHY